MRDETKLVLWIFSIFFFVAAVAMAIESKYFPQKPSNWELSI